MAEINRSQPPKAILASPSAPAASGKKRVRFAESTEERPNAPEQGAMAPFPSTDPSGRSTLVKPPLQITRPSEREGKVSPTLANISQSAVHGADVLKAERVTASLQAPDLKKRVYYAVHDFEELHTLARDVAEALEPLPSFTHALPESTLYLDPLDLDYPSQKAKHLFKLGQVFNAASQVLQTHGVDASGQEPEARDFTPLAFHYLRVAAMCLNSRSAYTPLGNLWEHVDPDIDSLELWHDCQRRGDVGQGARRLVSANLEHAGWMYIKESARRYHWSEHIQSEPQPEALLGAHF